MKRFVLWISIGLLIIIQLGFISSVRPFGVVPSLILVMVVVVGLQSTLSQSLIVAVIGGIAMDLTSGSDFGLRTVLFVLIALLTGLIRRSGIDVAGYPVAIVVVTVATILTDVLILLSVAGVTGYWPVWSLLKIMTVEILLNVILVLVLQPIYKRHLSEDVEVRAAI